MAELLLDWENTTREVAVAKPQIALLPIATMEQHGSHLPVGSKIILLDAIARRVALALPGGIYLLPSMPVGTSSLHEGTAGTLALTWQTMMSVMRDLIESLLAQDIRKVAVLIGLGQATSGTVFPWENSIAKVAVRQLNYEYPELQAVWVQPLGVTGRDLAAIFETAEQEVHAGEVVTSLMLHLAPELVKGRGADHAPAVSNAYLNYTSFRSLCPGGVWGYPSKASAEKGALAMDAIVRSTAAYISETLAQLDVIKAVRG